MFSLARNVAYFHHAAKEGVYDLSAKGPPRRIEGQTLGIVGMGRIGRTLARKATALGLRPLASDPAFSGMVEGVSLVPLDELLAESDFVSLHVPLFPETHHLIGAAQFALMKLTAYLINTARGGLIDHAALADALDANDIAGAALDVHEPEPPDLSLPPWNDPRVIVTPHTAFMSVESLHNLRTRASRQVADLLTGREPDTIVNRPA
jgi:D-3-phosphoglycerate dehydrogenase